MEAGNGDTYDEVMSEYYQDDRVRAVITLKVDTKDIDEIADKIAVFDVVDDVYLVTGDIDIVINVSFKSYAQLKRFLIGSISNIEGVKDIKTLMVVSVFKDKGDKVAPQT